MLAAGAISLKKIDDIEAQLKKKQHLIPNNNNITNVVLNSVLDHFVTPTSKVIQQLAARQRLFVSQEFRVLKKNQRHQQYQASDRIAEGKRRSP